MALLDPNPYAWKTTSPRYEEQDKELSELMSKAAALPDGEIVGGVIKFSVADGHAHYLVTNKNPLTIQHINFLDGYTIHPAFVRGLLEEDILELVQHEQRWARMLAERKPHNPAAGGRWNSR